MPGNPTAADRSARGESITYVTLGGEVRTVMVGAPTRRAPGPNRDREGLSRDQRRTKRNAAMLELGVHPATRQPTIEGNTCGECLHHKAHEHNGKRFHKCGLHRLGMSASAESDIRVSWPACTKFDDGTD